MKTFPDAPFYTDVFSLDGGGIDFLGLRWVALTMLGRDLIPELNNVTADMGTFFIGAWIPWKFQQLCPGGKGFTEKNYKAFREKVEVAFSLALREERDREGGPARNRIGATQKNPLPGKLSFKAASRSEANSLYAAAVYGPSLRAFGLVGGYQAQAKGGRQTLNIAVAESDADTIKIVERVENSLSTSKSFELMSSLDTPEVTAADITSLAKAGLDPAQYRAAKHGTVKACFRHKLLPTDPEQAGHGRTLTTRLILMTLEQAKNCDVVELRNLWYTGLLAAKRSLRMKDPVIARQLQRWSCFMARQFQRYIIELFLWCFEDAVSQGMRSIDAIVEYWSDRSKRGGRALTGRVRQAFQKTAGEAWTGDSESTAKVWGVTVHHTDERYEYVHEPQGDLAVVHAFRMLAGWYWRNMLRRDDPSLKETMNLGTSDRMSMRWFLDWIDKRQDRTLPEFLRDVFSDLIFAQHMRIALARFDGKSQRLRFLLGDSGIEPSVSAQTNLGQLRLPWMPDRLDMLVGLLCDCDVLERGEDGMLSPGPAADTLSM